jgi:uncharacterized paraquat-inducible protein A
MSVTPSLSYCNRCGAELNRKDRSMTKMSEASQESLVWALVAVTIVGIGSVIGLMAVMKEVVNFNVGMILAFSLLVFLAFMSVDSVIIWLLLRPHRDAGEALFGSRQKKLTTNELAETNARSLPEPLLSVTEHTTHTLEPAGRNRRTESDQL